MKRYGYLYHQVYDFENLYGAYLKARKSKRYRREVLKFTERLEENLINIQNELIWKTYRPRPVRQFYVYEPKKRLISALLFMIGLSIMHYVTLLSQFLITALFITVMHAEWTREHMKQ